MEAHSNATVAITRALLVVGPKNRSTLLSAVVYASCCRTASLVLLVLWWVRIIPVGIAVADCAVAPVVDDLDAALVHGWLPWGRAVDGRGCAWRA